MPAPGWGAPPPTSPLDLGAPSSEPPPAAPKKSPALVITVMASALVVVLAVGAFVVYRVTRTDGPSYPSEWDPRVADIASFVESQRGTLFDHPVYVDFLSEDDFKARVTTDESQLSDEDRATIQDSTASLRAMGLVSGDVDLLGQQNQLNETGILAFYDPDTEHVIVRGTDMTPDLKVTLAHELTHAWQDQQVDLNQVEKDAGPDGAVRVRAVFEGDAVNVQNAYVDKQLSDAERQQYQQTTQDQVDQADLSGVSSVLVALMGAPYSLGPSFTAIIKDAEGNSGLNKLLADPPASEAQLFDPTLYLDGVTPASVDEPAVPDGQEVIDDGQFGVLAWYLVLASRIDPKQALAAVDDWAGDSYVTYRNGDQVCVAARFQTDDATRAGEVKTALDAWAQQMPAGAATVTSVDDTLLELDSCDPGADASTATANDANTALAYPVERLVLMQQLLEQFGNKVKPEGAWCTADGLVSQLTLDELQSSQVPPDVQQKVVKVMTGCGIGN